VLSLVLLLLLDFEKRKENRKEKKIEKKINIDYGG